MATRGLVDSCIDAYITPGARPTTPKQLLARSKAGNGGYRSTKKSSAKDDEEAQFEAFCRMKDKQEKQEKKDRLEKERQEKQQKLERQIVQGVRPDPYAEFAADFSKVSISIQNREGMNAEGINGTWNFWKVRNGRLAFFREIFEESEDAQPEEDAALEAEDITGKPLIVLRLFLFYDRILNMWLVTDTGDVDGMIVADCGPAGESDLEQVWRVWSGDGWEPDERVSATVIVDGPTSEMLEGLRVKQRIQPPTQEKPAARRKQPASART